MGGFKQLKQQVLDAGLCVTCGSCVGFCPYVRRYAQKITTVFECDLEQGRCAESCPRMPKIADRIGGTDSGNPPSAQTLIGPYLRIVAAKAGQTISQGSFQNGGTVSALLIAALRSGIINKALITGAEEITPLPILTNNPDVILSCSGTKYTASSVNEKLNETVLSGIREIGFVGTGCHVLGAQRSWQSENSRSPLALVIGLFCSWSLDSKRFNQYLSEKLGSKKIIKMDVPPPPKEVFQITTPDEIIELPLVEIRPMIPKGCLHCSDLTARWADISVGALEGREGWNTLIARTPAGERLLIDAEREGFLELADVPKENISRIESAITNKQNKLKSIND